MPVSSSPAHALRGVAGVMLDRGFNRRVESGFPSELKDDLPSVVVDVASQALVIVAVEGTSTPGVVAEVVGERPRTGAFARWLAGGCVDHGEGSDDVEYAVELTGLDE